MSFDLMGLLTALGQQAAPTGPGGAAGTPPYMGGLPTYPPDRDMLGNKLMPAELAALQTAGPNTSPPGMTSDAMRSYLTGILGGGQQPPQAQQGATGGAAPTGNVPPSVSSALGAEGTAGAQAGLQGLPSGGGGTSFKGMPYPQAPQYTQPNIDLNKIYGDVSAQLREPTKTPGPTQMQGLAQLLGGAAQGFNEQAVPGHRLGQMIAGAGAGTSKVAQDMRLEEERLSAQFEQNKMEVDRARANVAAGKANAQVDLALHMNELANQQQQLNYARNVAAYSAQDPQINDIGNGFYLVKLRNPVTGQTTIEHGDALAGPMRAMQMAMMGMNYQYKGAEISQAQARARFFDVKADEIGRLTIPMGGRNVPLSGESAGKADDYLTYMASIAFKNTQIKDYIENQILVGKAGTPTAGHTALMQKPGYEKDHYIFGILKQQMTEKPELMNWAIQQDTGASSPVPVQPNAR
jgi:hypothetical protein